jgi:positive regulator of sigma E activity
MDNTVSTGSIKHEGTVLKIDKKSVFVCISSVSACSGCQAEGSCSISGQEEKIIEVSGSFNLKPGDKVTVLMKQSMGYAALLLGYLLPLISVIAVLIIAESFKVQELFAGLISISILIPYYLLLFIFRKRVNKKFTFSLKS